LSSRRLETKTVFSRTASPATSDAVLTAETQIFVSALEVSH